MKKIFQSSAGKMAYIDEGPGQIILFVHGNPSSSDQFIGIIDELKNDYRCIAPDLIGFGESEKPADWDYLPASQAQVLKEFIEGLKLQDIIFVFGDWGGPLSLSYIADHPQNTKAMVISNTWAWPVNKDWYYRAFSGFMGSSLGRYLIKQHHFFAKSVAKKAFSNRSKFSGQIKQDFLRHNPTPESRKGMWVFPREIIGSTPFLRQIWSKRESFQSIPALLIWGMDDIAFRPKELKIWQDNLHNAQSVQLPYVGHFPSLESPERYNEALQSFLFELHS